MEKLLSGHTMARFEGKELEDLRKEFPGDLNYPGWFSLNPGNITVPPYFDQVANKIHQVKFRESDIIVNTIPKSGTTWVQEIIWTMKNNPNLDNPSSSLALGERSPRFELDSYIGTEGPFYEDLFNQISKAIKGEVKEKEGIFLKFIDTFSSPRILSTHLPMCLLPPDTLDCAKIVYVARNPYDVCVSYYHFIRLLRDMNYSGTLEQFAERFINGKLLQFPYWEHVYQAWEKRNHPNLHFIFYEDLQKDSYAEILKLNTFLETNLTDQQMKNVMNFSSYSSMKKRGVVAVGVVETIERMNIEVMEKEGGFFRKGIVGDGKNSLTPEIIKDMKKWIDSKMKEKEIPFIYDIN